MSSKKISQLTNAAPITGIEVLPIVQSGSTVKTEINNIKEYITEGIQYTEVDISALEISNLGTSPKILLPVPALPNTYYDVQKAIVEYTFVTSNYSMTLGDRGYISNGTQFATFDVDVMLSSPVSNVYIFNGLHGGLVNVGAGELSGYPTALQESLTFGISNNPLAPGDGTIKVKLWYTIRTFG